MSDTLNRGSAEVKPSAPGWPLPRPAWRLVARLGKLYAGLIGFGVSLALMVEADLGLGPWDVLHQGAARQLGLPIGWVVIGVSALVLLAWIPLRERPGFGTVSNAVVVGLVIDAALAWLPAPQSMPLRMLFLAAGIVGTAAATGLYIGAGLGAGPRDGLMTGLARRGHSIRLVRTGIEMSVLAVGFALGGTIGVGTVAYAVTIGPLVHYFLTRLAPGPAPAEPATAISATAAGGGADAGPTAPVRRGTPPKRETP